MALITIDDLAAELAPFTVGTGTPDEDETQQYINDVDAEVRALVLGYGGTWPPSTDAAANFVRLTEISGVKAEWLDNRYQLAQTPPDALTRAREDYQRRLARLPTVVKGMEAAAADAGDTSSDGPLVVRGCERRGPRDFGVWTEARASHHHGYAPRGWLPW